jgi:hypothetical protein
MVEMQVAKVDLHASKPTVDNRIADLEQAVHDLGDRVEQLLGGGSSPKKEASIEHPMLDLTQARSGLMPGSAHLGPTLSGAVSGPIGHHEELHHRSAGHRVVYWCEEFVQFLSIWKILHLVVVAFTLSPQQLYLSNFFPNLMVQILGCG